MAYNDFNVFEDKDFSWLVKEIYTRSKDKKKKIDDLIDTLKPLIKTIEDAQQIVPLVKDYLDVGIKNDDILVKLASVIQRLASGTTKDTAGGDLDFELTEEEKEDLLEKAKNELEKDVVLKEEDLDRKLERLDGLAKEKEYGA